MERPSPEHARQSLRDHVLMKAIEARARCGGGVDRAGLEALLVDRSQVRYPVGIRFDAEPLRDGEFACLEALGERPEEGFCLFVHPMFESDDDLLPLLVAYYIPSVNYGSVATEVEAEIYGSALNGLDREAYYRRLCSAADRVPRRS